MGITEDMTDDLAKDTLAAAEKANDQTIVDEISTVLGNTSATAQEAYLTAVRIRRAIKRAREVLGEFTHKPDT